MIDGDDDDDTQVYKRHWVGLTDEEIDHLLPEIVSGGSFTVITYGRAVARAIETRLREKNT